MIKTDGFSKPHMFSHVATFIFKKSVVRAPTFGSTGLYSASTDQKHLLKAKSIIRVKRAPQPRNPEKDLNKPGI